MAVEPGWFDDPGDARQLRWWDGSTWTSHVHPKSIQPVAPAAGTEAQPMSPAAGTAPVHTGVASPVASSSPVPQTVTPIAPSTAGAPRSYVPPEISHVAGLSGSPANLAPTSNDAPVPAASGEHPGVAAGVLDGQRRRFGGRRAVEEENERLREALSSMGVAERDALRLEIEALRRERTVADRDLGEARSRAADEVRRERAAAQAEMQTIRAELRALRHEVVETRDQAMLQEVGIYQYRHPLDDAAAYKAQLAVLADRIKMMARTGDAVVGATGWTVNGSATEGRRMVKEFSKLMLRAYNNEADAAVRSMRPYALASSTARLDKAATMISKLGKTMSIHVAVEYHQLRLRELELTADYLVKVAEQKEREREERARLREEAKARQDYEREQERLRKELSHFETALAAMRANGDSTAAEAAEAEIAALRNALEGVNRRAANVRAGYVYVISNVGAFGANMVKIGMTRRLEPMDRVRELGDASVPFRFDVHALFFSDDAVGVETRLHQALASRRVNLVNSHREFFYATPLDVKRLLAEIQGSLLHYTDDPVALEWHQSENSRTRALSGATP